MLTFLKTFRITYLLDITGLKKINLDDDPLKSKIKQTRIWRKLKKFDDAISLLHEALQDAYDRKDEHAITYVLDELANVFYEKGDFNEADKNFREVLRRHCFRIVFNAMVLDWYSCTGRRIQIQNLLELA